MVPSLWCWRGVRQSVACGFSPQENKETKLREASQNQDQIELQGGYLPYGVL